MQSALLGGMEDGVHARGEFLDAETGSEDEHEHDQEDVAAGIGVVFVPAHGVFVIDGNERVDLVDVLDVGLVLVFVVVFGHTRGEVVLFSDDGGLDHALQVLGVGVDLGHESLCPKIILIFLSILVQLPSITIRIGILLKEFLHFLLYLGVKHLVIVGSQAVILGLPRLGVIIIGLQSRQHVLGQVGCGIMLGLGVGQQGVQEKQDDEQAEDEFVADEFFAFVCKHGFAPSPLLAILSDLFPRAVGLDKPHGTVVEIHHHQIIPHGRVSVKILIVIVLPLLIVLDSQPNALAIHTQEA